MKKILLLSLLLTACATTEWSSIGATTIKDAIEQTKAMGVNEVLVPMACAFVEHEVEPLQGNYKLTKTCTRDMSRVSTIEICTGPEPFFPSEGYCLISWQ